MIESGDVIDVKIHNAAYGGDGIGKIDGQVCFVPGALPDEIVRVKVKTLKNNFIRASLLEVLQPSPHRIEPACPWAFRPEGDGRIKRTICPGCSYQHLDYQAEVQLKQQQFADMLRHDAGLEDANILPPIASPLPSGYRNKITLHAEREEGKMLLGYYMSDNRSIIEIDSCPLAHPEINRLISETRALPAFTHSLHPRMTVTFRHTPHDGSRFWRNSPSANMSWLREDTPAGTVSVPPGSFFQVNPGCAAIMLNTVAAIINECRPSTVIDLYCGSAIFGVTAAKHGVSRIIGLELDPAATAAAEYNLKNAGAEDFKIITGNAGKLFKELQDSFEPDSSLMISDPPRTGMDKAVLSGICNSRVRNLAYISCSPDTLCRDLRFLSRHGYRVQSSQLIDMFPRTPHFETISRLTRDDG